MAEHVVFTNLWQIHELRNANVANLFFSYVGKDPMSTPTILDLKPSERQLEEIIEIGELIGECEKIRWLYYSTEENISMLWDSFDLKTDGVIRTSNNPIKLHSNYVAADAMFHSVVSSVKRLVDTMEHHLEKSFGSESNDYVEWKSLTSYSYDNNLVYATMYDLRNCIEHDFLTISLVNHDTKHKRCGLAINVDNDLVNSSLKQRTKDRLCEWAIERTSKGEPAWLSVGECIESYRYMVESLYGLWLDSCITKLETIVEKHAPTVDYCQNKVLIWTGDGTKKHSATGQPRAYRLSFKYDLLSLYGEQQLLSKALIKYTSSLYKHSNGKMRRQSFRKTSPNLVDIAMARMSKAKKRILPKK